MSIEVAANGLWENFVFVGSDEAMFLDPDPFFGNYHTENWNILLNCSSMVLNKPGKTLAMPLDLDGNLMVATYTNKKVVQIGNMNYEVQFGKIKYD